MCSCVLVPQTSPTAQWDLIRNAIFRFESGDNEYLRERIRSLRDRLLAEHLGRTEDEVATATRENGSLIASIESLRGGERTLKVLDGTTPGCWMNLCPMPLFSILSGLSIKKN